MLQEQHVTVTTGPNVKDSVELVHSSLPGGRVVLHPGVPQPIPLASYRAIAMRYQHRILRLDGMPPPATAEPEFTPTHLFKDEPVVKGELTQKGKQAYTDAGGTAHYVAPETWEKNAKDYVPPVPKCSWFDMHPDTEPCDEPRVGDSLLCAKHSKIFGGMLAVDTAVKDAQATTDNDTPAPDVEGVTTDASEEGEAQDKVEESDES
jgi:hypothetical protein